MKKPAAARRKKKGRKIEALRVREVTALIAGQKYRRTIRIRIKFHTGQTWTYRLGMTGKNETHAREKVATYMADHFPKLKESNRKIRISKPDEIDPYLPPFGAVGPG